MSFDYLKAQQVFSTQIAINHSQEKEINRSVQYTSNICKQISCFWLCQFALLLSYSQFFQRFSLTVNRCRLWFKCQGQLGFLNSSLYKYKQETHRPSDSNEYPKLYNDFLPEEIILHINLHLHHRINKYQQWYKKAAS